MTAWVRTSDQWTGGVAHARVVSVCVHVRAHVARLLRVLAYWLMGPSEVWHALCVRMWVRFRGRRHRTILHRLARRRRAIVGAALVQLLVR